MKARLPQGMGGGPQNMQNMLRQAQKMQENLENKKAELEEKEYVVTSGGGMVEITAKGDHTIKAIGINPEVVDPEQKFPEIADSLCGFFSQSFHNSCHGSHTDKASHFNQDRDFKFKLYNNIIFLITEVIKWALTLHHFKI